MVLTLKTLLSLVYSGSVELTSVQMASEYHPNIVRLQCSGGGAGAISYHRRLPNAQNTTVAGATEGALTVEINWESEGEYYCMVGEAASNSLWLIAFPESDQTIPRDYTVMLGDTVVMNCTIPIGLLSNRYRVQWYKGLTEVSPSVEEFRHITVQNSSLVFSGVKVSDYSDGYFCNVTVSRGDPPNYEIVSRQGSTISLKVEAPLQMSSGVSSVSVLVGDDVQFTCEASGAPAPQFRWLLWGLQHTDGITTTSEVRATTVDVQSTLVLPHVLERDGGAVTCVAFHDNQGLTVLASSSANLVVLTNNFEVEIFNRQDKVQIKATLPVTIPGFFSLQVRFFSDEQVHKEEIAISDPSLADTDTIKVTIPEDKLPGFSPFSVAVAIRSNDRNGEFTERSAPLSKCVAVVVLLEFISCQEVFNTTTFQKRQPKGLSCSCSGKGLRPPDL